MNCCNFLWNDNNPFSYTENLFLMWYPRSQFFENEKKSIYSAALSIWNLVGHLNVGLSMDLFFGEDPIKYACSCIHIKWAWIC